MEPDERIETRSIKVELTDEEFVERAMELARCDEQIERLDQERKDSDKSYKRQIGAIENRKLELRRIIQDVEEFRDIECEWVENWKQKCWELLRQDTSVVIDTKAMTKEEMQGKLNYPSADTQEPSAEPSDDGKGKKKKRGKDAS